VTAACSIKECGKMAAAASERLQSAEQTMTAAMKIVWRRLQNKIEKETMAASWEIVKRMLIEK
jgi:hypothetical protein